MTFAWMKRWKVILVTGPQRSGTTIAAKMIAKDTEYRFIPEEDFNIKKEYLFRNIVNQHSKIVVQCPAVSSIIHEFGKREDILIVFMRRSYKDIKASQERIGWEGEEEEKKKYHVDNGRPIAKIKYDFWDTYQKHKVKNYIDLCYSDLEEHLMWVPKEQRKYFGTRQTEL